MQLPPVCQGFSKFRKGTAVAGFIGGILKGSIRFLSWKEASNPTLNAWENIPQAAITLAGIHPRSIPPDLKPEEIALSGSSKYIP